MAANSNKPYGGLADPGRYTAAATNCIILQAATNCILQYMQRAGIAHCNTLENTMTHCNTQYTCTKPLLVLGGGEFGFVFHTFACVTFCTSCRSLVEIMKVCLDTRRAAFTVPYAHPALKSSSLSEPRVCTKVGLVHKRMCATTPHHF